MWERIDIKDQVVKNLLVKTKAKEIVSRVWFQEGMVLGRS